MERNPEFSALPDYQETLDLSSEAVDRDLINSILCEDPSAAYPLMDHTTRAWYCEVVGRLAERMNMPARSIARRAIEFASEAQSSHPTDEHFAHVGYYLIDDGRVKLEESIGYKPLWRERCLRAARRHPAAFCLGTLSVLTVTLLALLIGYANQVGTRGFILVGLAVLLLVPTSEVVTSILQAMAIFFEQRALPKMDFAQGIREELRTMIVVPAVFSSEATVRELLETIEAHYLANQDDHIFFALLGDYSDAAQEKMPEDEALLSLAMEGVAELNVRYQQVSPDRFYLFHRRRKWNKSEDKWMGWERKRGKLHEFNRLLRGARDTSYIVCTAEQGLLTGVRYVITLDSDTQLPRDGARRLIGTISHPLNRAKVDVISGRVMRGYVIIQPDIRPSVPSAPRARIPMLFSNKVQIDSDTKVKPDIYQNLFGEGIYIGKGLYEVDAFEAVLKDRVPENSLLSHDLFESLYARTATVADIEVSESQRVFYEASVKRLHRWVRGDWQLLPWLLPKVRDANENTVPNVLTTFARWRILDNLRRSLMLPILFLWLVATLTMLPGSESYWTLLILLTLVISISLPMIAPVLLVLPHELSRLSVLESIWYLVKACVMQVISTAIDVLFLTIFLAHQSFLRMDAIARTLYRLFISRKHLLEWSTTASDQREGRYDLGAFLLLMWPVPIITVVTGALILISKPAALIQAAPFLIAWMVSPLFAYWINRQMLRRANKFDEKAEVQVRLDARRAWRDLERVSNMSQLRLLLWTLAAHGLGCFGVLELAERLESGFAKIQKSGNFYHGGGGLQLLQQRIPQRVLEIENGNLGGHLQTLKRVCSEIGSQPVFDERVLKGLADSVALMKEETRRIGEGLASKGAIQKLHEEIDACVELLSPAEQEKVLPMFSAWRKLFSSLAQHAAIIKHLLDTVTLEKDEGVLAESHFWTDFLIHQTREFSRDLGTLAPWTAAETEQLATIIKRHDAAAFQQWSRIMKMLDHVPAFSDLPEKFIALNDLAELRSQLKRVLPNTGTDYLTVLNGFEVLTSAIEESHERSKNLLSRYARLAQMSEALVASRDFRSLFDEERQVPEHDFQNLQRVSANR